MQIWSSTMGVVEWWRVDIENDYQVIINDRCAKLIKQQRGRDRR